MKCPGQDTRFWKSNAICDVACPKCGGTVEFFRDDTARTCDACGHRFLNPNLDFGCAAYCDYAEQCLGTLPKELLNQKKDLFKDRVAIEMKRYFKTDFKRIGHAMRVARYAERIGKREMGNMGVIMVAAYLHDIGIPEAERKYGGQAADFHEQEGCLIAADILQQLNADDTLTQKVCGIIERHHHPRSEESVDFRVVYDADRLANLEEAQKEGRLGADQLKERVETGFLTVSGRKEAEDVLMRESS